MNRRYVILHEAPEPSRTRRGPARMRESTVGVATPPAAPKVDVEELKPAAAATVAKSPSVRAVAPVLPMKLIAPVSTGGVSARANDGVAWGVRAVGADVSPFDGKGIVVAILDTGIDPSHPAFKGVQLERKNFTKASDDDEDGHGTHCAGTVFGRNVDGVRIGVAPGITKALIGKVLGKGGGGSDRVVQAIQWAVNEGANVISMSLGIDFPGYVQELVGDGVPPALATSMALDDYRSNVLLFERLASLIAAQGAFQQSTVLVAAAGNESQRDVDPDFEIGVSPPAVSDGIVSVAAVSTGAQGFNVASFSNVGARVSGPGVDIESAQLGGGLVTMSGTSMATPHVAGVAALWAQQLESKGSLNGRLLAECLVGKAITTGMVSGFDPRDVGAGMVQAPRD